ncbi:hypothetical protein SEPCBS119000_002245 [Sporothrix epigloea]|uniref:DNA replication regulator Sld3 C-terminal domain-containing protein n=1 Tax=Sporothrix epigloea TaxID=1892477 RepID=A0ABP0DF40_9PEZI
MLLPREHLPLSCLDLAAPSGDLPLSRRFQSQIRILELEGRLGSNVLLARLPSSNSSSSAGEFSTASSVFAIERDESGLYTLCRLGSWVNLETLSQHATAVCQQRMPVKAPSLSASTGQERATITPQMYKEQGKKRLVIAELQSIVRRRPALSQLAPEAVVESQADADSVACGDLPSPLLGTVEEDLVNSQALVESQELCNGLPARPASQIVLQAAPTLAKPAVLPSPPASDATKQLSMEPTDVMTASEPLGPPTADGIFNNIRSQYFEALYHSLGSLAYFAKGPLSRARAAFHLDCDSNLEMIELIDFLKSIVISSATIDKKYRETVPELVSHLRTLGEMSDHKEIKRSSKKPKKMKLGSSGLYTDEDVHVRKWWAANKPIPNNDEVLPRPEEVRHTISCLRTRETQLQIILILEIMALETMQNVSDAGESQLPGMPMEMVDTPAKKAAPKKRNKLNLPLLIDLHADRLCIWQSTMSDEFRAQAESQIVAADEPSASQTTQSDPLKDFCVDIIIPFFSPRLPLVCNSLNRKLGGPIISASKSRSKNAPSSTRHSSNAKLPEKLSSLSGKSGVARKRPSASTDKTRSLERVLSNERLRRSVSRGPNDAIAQMRCATAAPVPGLKRELSDSLLASIPRAASSKSSKDGPPKSLTRSTSDMMNSSGRADQSRAARNKALVEAELQGAIDALKKPNRVLAGRETVEAAERRLFGVAAKGSSRHGNGHARSRGIMTKTMPVDKANPSRSLPGTLVQVQATPASNRVQDIFATTAIQSFESQGPGHQLGRDPYRISVSRELLAAGRSQQQHGLLLSSPIIMSTPAAGRVQMTPAHTSTALPGHLASGLVETSPTESAEATKTNIRKYTLSRSTKVKVFTEQDESVPTSSPVAQRRAAPLFAQFHGEAGVQPRQHLSLGSVDTIGSDTIPASSPLQARSQLVVSIADFRKQVPVPALLQPASLNLTGEDDHGAALFETPTKARSVPHEKPTATKMAAGSPVAAISAADRSFASASTSAMGDNSILSLYQKMGWDDDLDELD